jgi:hypothetical protein
LVVSNLSCFQPWDDDPNWLTFSVAIATKHGTTVQDIVMNRRVDKIAKTSATLNHSFFVNLDERNLKIEKWQWWLTKLHTRLGVPKDHCT